MRKIYAKGKKKVKTSKKSKKEGKIITRPQHNTTPHITIQYNTDNITQHKHMKRQGQLNTRPTQDTTRPTQGKTNTTQDKIRQNETSKTIPASPTQDQNMTRSAQNRTNTRHDQHKTSPTQDMANKIRRKKNMTSKTKTRHDRYKI
jgi:hypothetical protein